MSFGLTQLCQQIGDENIAAQSLADCFAGARVMKRGGTTISFVTDAAVPSDFVGRARKVCIILWIARDDYDAAVEVLRERK